MSFTIDLSFSRLLEVKFPFDSVFDMLADRPKSISHFPNVETLVDLGGNCYRWEISMMEVFKFAGRPVFACKYTDNRAKGYIKWTPIKGQGNVLLSGQWTIKALDENHTRLKLFTRGQMIVPVPSLLKLLITPIVVKALNGLVDGYIGNLGKTLCRDTKYRHTVVSEAFSCQV